MSKRGILKTVLWTSLVKAVKDDDSSTSFDVGVCGKNVTEFISNAADCFMLIEYVDHLIDCRSRYMTIGTDNTVTREPCSCGLDELKERLMK